MIGICTDSSSQLPAELAQRFGIEVVPLTVTVDDIDYLEGVDLDADGFYEKYAHGVCPIVSTSQPSPGQFAVAYEELAARGCNEILSIHVASSVSGTINAARLAAHSLPMPVRLVDSGTASFGVSCCVWAAAAAIATGATIDEAASLAEQLAPTIGNVFAVGALGHLHRGGRAREALGGEGVPVLSLRDGKLEVVQHAATALDAVNSMASYTLAWGNRLRVAIGYSDAATSPLADALDEALSEAAGVLDVVRYRIGPSIGAHTGPGSVGCFMFAG